MHSYFNLHVISPFSPIVVVMTLLARNGVCVCVCVCGHRLLHVFDRVFHFYSGSNRNDVGKKRKNQFVRSPQATFTNVPKMHTHTQIDIKSASRRDLLLRSVLRSPRPPQK